jgi:hypothetical protein
MADLKRAITYLSIIAFLGLSGLGLYSHLWESKAPKREIKNAIVTNIQPANFIGEFSSYHGQRVSLEGEASDIYFPLRNWDSTVSVGDSVDIVAKSTFPLFGKNLEGISITDNK